LHAVSVASGDDGAHRFTVMSDEEVWIPIDTVTVLEAITGNSNLAPVVAAVTDKLLQATAPVGAHAQIVVSGTVGERSITVEIIDGADVPLFGPIVIDERKRSYTLFVSGQPSLIGTHVSAQEDPVDAAGRIIGGLAIDPSEVEAVQNGLGRILQALNYSGVVDAQLDPDGDGVLIESHDGLWGASVRFGSSGTAWVGLPSWVSAERVREVVDACIDGRDSRRGGTAAAAAALWMSGNRPPIVRLQVTLERGGELVVELRDDDRSLHAVSVAHADEAAHRFTVMADQYVILADAVAVLVAITGV
jgi:hypothetical protein